MFTKLIDMLKIRSKSLLYRIPKSCQLFLRTEIHSQVVVSNNIRADIQQCSNIINIIIIINNVNPFAFTIQNVKRKHVTKLISNEIKKSHA